MMADVTLPLGFRREAHRNLPSTSSRALAAARAGDPGGLWVTAEEQSEGRGRRGRGWSTPAGNLAASLLLIDPAPPATAASVSFVAGVALHQAAIDCGGPGLADRLRLKWPNDLLLDRRKVAGILVEGEKLPSGAFAVVVGIGVNCVSHPETGTSHPAGDFRSLGAPIAAEPLFAALARRMAAELVVWDRGRGFAGVRAAWLARAGGIGEGIRVNLSDRTIDGRFESLDAEGRLVLLRDDGRRETVSAGDLFFAAAG
jgi:BirA family biotin operon repressor/biotin-[acetyl-CoA-carboxylase] ligase